MANRTQVRFSSMADIIKKSHVDLKGKQPKDLYERLHQMRSNGESALKDHKYEIAYIYFKRWQNTVDFIKNTEKNGKKHFSLLTSETEVGIISFFKFK